MVAIVIMVATVTVVVVVKTGQDRTGQVFCDWQLSQFLRCFFNTSL